MEATKFGKYEIRATIGRGAVGVVYQAWDPQMARNVAIKALPLLDLDDEGREQYARFKREAQAAGRLHHPNIVSAFDYGETDTAAYIVMEFLSGPSLKALLAKHEPLPLDRIGTIMHGLLRGLQHSHDRGVVHRDIKPANIVFSADGEVKITDFGIAHLDTSGMTRAGSVLGTPAYMAPEQVLGDPVDARTDLFSTGVVLYEMLTGRRPFDGSTSSIMHKIVHLQPPQPSQLAATVSAGIDAIIAKALAKHPQERYQSALEFDAALSIGLAHTPEPDPAAEPETTVAMRATPPLTAGRPEIPQTPARPPQATPLPAGRRTQWPMLLAGTGVVTIAAIAWLGLSFNGRDSPPAVRSSANVTGATAPAVASASLPAPTKAASNPAASASPATPAATPAAARAVANPATPSSQTVRQPSANNTTPHPTPDPLQPLRDQVRTIVASAPCSLVTAEVTAPDKVRLQGVSALGEASELEVQASLQRAVHMAAPQAAISWGIRRIDGPYCPVLDALRLLPHGSPGFDVALSLPGDSTRLGEGETIQVAAALPSPPVELMLDLFTPDGQVQHLHSGPVDAEQRAAMFPLQSHKPYGEQLLSAIAASARLPGEARPEREPAAAYLKDLQSALSRMSAKDVHLSATVLPIAVNAR